MGFNLGFKGLIKEFKIDIYKSIQYVHTVAGFWTCSCWTLSGRVWEF